MNVIKRILVKIILKMLPERYAFYKHGKGRTVYLTLDDGPDEKYTPLLLEVLKKHSVKATFFLVGDNVRQNESVVKMIHDDGHVLANHSMSHNLYHELNANEQLNGIVELNELLKKIDGKNSRSFRPPRGDISLNLLFKLARRKLSVAMWSYDSMDYKNWDLDKLIDFNKNRDIQNGEVILFHDDNITSVKALDKLIPLWQSKGYKFESLDIS
ncbi:MAG: polysaccharide deacetylase family protein [Thioalkalispiraceae bacterium]|jgi:peptidoglycan/xylan/chitin deacetylase (PgdA/CDA1 family)